MSKLVLIVNAGSATLKFKLFRADNRQEIAAGNFERINLPRSFLVINERKWNFQKISNHQAALRIILHKLGDKKKYITLVGHRVVHGGQKFVKPTLVTKKVWPRIAKYNELAPLHNPANLAVIKSCFSLLPGLKNIAVFDTAFFANLQPEHYLYALPYYLYQRFGIKRYGFHGISHEYAVQAAAMRLKKHLKKINLITVHLGNGCSIVAVQRGQPLTTSLGFTPLAGLVMGTRSGDIDPAIPLFLQKKFHLNYQQVDNILNRESGLFGLSGFTSDMREVLYAAGQKVVDYQGRFTFSARQKKMARLALRVFIHRLRQYLILYAGLLGRVEAVVFTGAIGERSPVVRKLALQSVGFVNKPKILVVPANEELAIFQQIRNRL